ncbi:uncharacterized protein LOC106734736, partial [Tupaia chinensis]|uniref:uncharacterized protein LOC106734736 n=1 Tax=Tupaia chinensis TaxID=246437 RepID=UPI000703DD2C
MDTVRVSKGHSSPARNLDKVGGREQRLGGPSFSPVASSSSSQGAARGRAHPDGRSSRALPAAGLEEAHQVSVLDKSPLPRCRPQAGIGGRSPTPLGPLTLGRSRRGLWLRWTPRNPEGESSRKLFSTRSRVRTVPAGLPAPAAPQQAAAPRSVSSATLCPRPAPRDTPALGERRAPWGQPRNAAADTRRRALSGRCVQSSARVPQAVMLSRPQLLRD